MTGADDSGDGARSEDGVGHAMNDFFVIRANGCQDAFQGSSGLVSPPHGQNNKGKAGLFRSWKRFFLSQNRHTAQAPNRVYGIPGGCDSPDQNHGWHDPRPPTRLRPINHSPDARPERPMLFRKTLRL